MNLFNLDANMIDPNIVYLLLVVGLWVAIMALYTPGTGLLEVIAFLALGGSVILLGVMPTNWWAVLLLVVGVLSFHVIPFLKPEWSSWSIGGLALQAAGGIFLFSGRGVPWFLIPVTIAIALVYHYAILMPTLKTLRQAPVLNEDDLLLGVEGRVVQPIDPIGVVHVHGENWTATSDAPIEAGEEVVVLERDGLQLRVEALKHKRTPIAQEEAQQNGS